MKLVGCWLFALVGFVVVCGVLPQLLDPDLSYSKIIRAYCTYVKDERFYRQHKLRENCMLNVQIYQKGKQVHIKTLFECNLLKNTSKIVRNRSHVSSKLKKTLVFHKLALASQKIIVKTVK